MRKNFFMGIAASLFIFAGCETTEIVEDEPEHEPEVFVPINNPEPVGLVEVLDGFEEGLYWLSASGLDGDFGDDISMDADTTDRWSSEGDYSCLLVFAPGMDKKSVATFGCSSLFFNDFTGYCKEKIIPVLDEYPKLMDLYNFCGMDTCQTPVMCPRLISNKKSDLILQIYIISQ